MSTRGIIGLDYQPDALSAEYPSATLGADLVLDCSTEPPTGTLTWLASQDFGLLDHCDAQGKYLWVGSACLRTTEAASESSGVCEVDVVGCQFGAPNENVSARTTGATTMITTYPTGIEGMTATLYGWALSDGAIVSGDQPFLLRTGKVKAGASMGGDGGATIQVGGFTDQFRVDVPTGTLSARLGGFRFNDRSISSLGYAQSGVAVLPQPHLWVFEYFSDPDTDANYIATTERTVVQDCDLLAVDICSGVVDYSSRQGILEDLVAAMNTASSNMTYTLSTDGRVTYIPTAAETGNERWDVCVFGPLAWVLGIGHMGYLEVGAAFAELLSNPRDPAFARPEYLQIGLNNDGEYPTGRRDNKKVEKAWKFWLARSTETSMSAVRRTHDCLYASLSPHTKWETNPFYADYYYQYQVNLIDNYRDAHYDTILIDACPVVSALRPVPEDESGDPTLRMVVESDYPLVAGDTIALGSWTKDDGTPAIYGVIDDVTSTGIEIAEMSGFPYALASWHSLGERYRTDENFRALVGHGANMDADEIEEACYLDDPFRVAMPGVVSSDSAVALFEAITGIDSPSITIPRIYQITGIRNIHDRGDTSVYRGLIDWTAMANVISSSGVDGVTYRLPVETDEQTGLARIDVLQMLQQVCLTHGVRMSWEYREAQKAHVLTFVPMSTPTVSASLLLGRAFSDAHIVAGRWSGVSGDEWRYNRILAKYIRADGGEDDYDVRLQDRRVSFAGNAKTLQISDECTILPATASEQRTVLAERFVAYLRHLSQVRTLQTVPLALTSYASVAVGQGAAIDWKPLLDRRTGRRNNGFVSGQIVGAEYSLGGSPGVSVRFACGVQHVGISPTLECTYDSLAGDVATLTFSRSTKKYGSLGVHLNDAAYFDCIDYDDSTGAAVARGCSCGDYAVAIFEANTPVLTFDAAYSEAGQNVWMGRASVAVADGDLTSGSGTIDIELDDTNNFSTVASNNGEFIVVYAPRDDADLQPCQTLYYGWLGDAAGNAEDSSGGLSRSLMVGAI